MRDSRTVDDLSDEEYEDYTNNPDNYEDVTQNTYDLYDDLTHPNGYDDQLVRKLFLLRLQSSCNPCIARLLRLQPLFFETIIKRTILTIDCQADARAVLPYIVATIAESRSLKG